MQIRNDVSTESHKKYSSEQSKSDANLGESKVKKRKKGFKKKMKRLKAQKEQRNYIEDSNNNRRNACKIFFYIMIDGTVRDLYLL